jgi:MFS family permease
MMMVGWPSGATFAARSFHRFGLRRMLIGGSVFLPLGAVFFATLGPESTPVFAGIGSLVMGLGMGIVSVSALILIQEIVQPSERGSATASNLFSRNLGSTLGAAMFGAVLNYGLAHSSGVAAVTSDQLRQILDAAPGNAASNMAVRLVLHQSLHLTFVSILVISLVAVVSLMLVPTIKLGQARPASAN